MSSDASFNRDKRNLNYVLRSGLAGGIAGCVAKTVVAPLDRVKILFQASNPEFQKYAGTWSGAFGAGSAIFKENGVRGLFQGHSATLLRVFPYAAIKFMAYEQVHHILMPTRAQETNFRRFAAGSISGMMSVFFTYPLELIRVRLAFKTTHASASGQRPTLTSAITRILNEGNAAPGATTSFLFQRFPILKFYRGFTVTLVGMIPYAGTSFLTWGFLRAHLLPPPSDDSARTTRGKLSSKVRKKGTPLADLGIGAISGAISQTASYPFEIVRRRMQVGGLTSPDRWLRWGETVRAVWRTSGWRGFYVGLSIGYLKIVPMTAVSFAVWESGKRFLDV